MFRSEKKNRKNSNNTKKSIAVKWLNHPTSRLFGLGGPPNESNSRRAGATLTPPKYDPPYMTQGGPGPQTGGHIWGDAFMDCVCHSRWSSEGEQFRGVWAVLGGVRSGWYPHSTSEVCGFDPPLTYENKRRNKKKVGPRCLALGGHERKTGGQRGEHR